ncbi:histidine--tRNA ligase [bacterium]|nr:histidine--tRNA ligase [bacterium]NIN93295.1 histidine--tRNA ligase [bacterium]NIO19090.1 histidine--tRNA ligase [bacterium]NIO74221.1 histidine--tRNA ligase [bacterium]
MKYKSIRGTRDILPEEARKWQYLERVAREIFQKYGYEEVRTPIFEVTELFQRSIGEDTDIVTKEMYTFLDKKGRSLTLRPEGTAGIIRAVIENNLYRQNRIARLYYLGPMYRYERPQKGRQREFYQIGAELIGPDNPASDVEIITMVWDLFDVLGLKNLILYLNSVGCPRCRAKYRERLKDYFKSKINIMCDDCQRRYPLNPMRILDCKEKKDRAYIEKSPKISDYLCQDCQEQFEKVKEYLNFLKIDYSLDPCMVRGLDYYTKAAFEIKYEGLGAQDTLAAGGRYDRLVRDLGGPDLPAVGFALGVERVLEAIDREKISLPSSGQTDVYVVTLGEEALRESTKLIRELRQENLRILNDFNPTSLKAQLRQADKLKAKFALIIGQDELSEKRAIVRNMSSGGQEIVPFSELKEYLVRNCSRSS